MKNILITSLLLITLNTFGQFAVIDDKDGFCNVRSEAKSGNNIIDKLQNGKLVYCFDEESNWINIDYNNDNKDLNGFIYTGRVKYIENYTRLQKIDEGDDKLTLAGNSIKVTVLLKEFDSAKNKISIHKKYNVVEKINGKPYWGTDGGMPKTQYKSIAITIDGKHADIPQHALADVFEPNLNSTFASYDDARKILYIYATNGDGAGGYAIIWKIQNGVYNERFVMHGF
jgi:hypothetical protein